MADSSTKRKANGPPDVEGGSRITKRQKAQGAPDGSSETPETTLEKGLDFIRAMKNAKDKTGRSIIDEFLSLPDPAQFPVYYEQIKLPMSIDIIEDKLRRKQYPNLTAMESDFKRLVQNAKEFNDKKSIIYEDAERVRKGASNWFVRWNPAYNDRSYTAKPTPIPDGTNGMSTVPAPAPVTLKITNRSAPARAPATPAAAAPAPKAKQVMNNAEGVNGSSGDAGDFTGKSFQDAQMQLVQELLDYEDGGLQVFQPFHYLPNRSLTDYYHTIKNPVSLKGIQKRVRGVRGRGPPTDITDYQSWDALEDDLSYIWNNCREYNEDGSEMFNLADEFEEVCRQKLAAARSQVEQPAQPKIKLNLGSAAQQKQPSSIKLKFGAKASPSPAPGASNDRGTPGVMGNPDALQRQRDFVSASINGGRPTSAAGQNPFARSGSSGAQIPALNAHAAPHMYSNGVKTEGQSPAMAAIRPQPVAGSMPPPNGVTPRPTSGSPYPQSQPHAATANHYQPSTSYVPQTNAFVQSRHRPASQSVKDSILPAVTIASHPAIQTSKPFKRIIKAHPRRIEQSYTFTVPSTLHTFHITPYLPPSVTSRAHRIFVLVNGLRVSPLSRPGEEVDKSRPVYEARLERGAVGRIEVEVLAEKKGAQKGKDEVEREKYTIYMHVMRS